jgi:hypothetical protein
LVTTSECDPADSERTSSKDDSVSSRISSPLTVVTLPSGRVMAARSPRRNRLPPTLTRVADALSRSDPGEMAVTDARTGASAVGTAAAGGAGAIGLA